MKNLNLRKYYNIIYVVNHAVPYGANVALLNILDGVMLNGVKPLVVVGEEGTLCLELKKRNIEYHKINHYFAVYPKVKSFRDLLLFVPRALRIILINRAATSQLVKLASKFEADLIHTNIGPTHIGYNASCILKIPHVWHIREYQDLNLKMKPMPSKAGFSKKINSINNYPIPITKDISRHYQVFDNSKVIYDGVLEYSKIQFVNEKEDYFLFVGSLSETKGIRLLIMAFIEFAKCNTTKKLKIAGNGKKAFVVMLKKIVDENGLHNRIEFLGFRKDINSLMSKATALIVSSKYEGFGFITVEAMFNGCLVIGHNSGGTKEILEKDDLGILYKGQEALTEAMNTVVVNGIGFYFPKIKKAQNQAQILYSIEKNVSSILELYMSILKK